jgi:hypothetical protein
MLPLSLRKCRLSSRDYFLPGFIIAKFENLAFFFFFVVVLTPIERSRRHKFLRRSGRHPSNWIHLASSIAIEPTGLELERQTFEAARIPKL